MPKSLILLYCVIHSIYLAYSLSSICYKNTLDLNLPVRYMFIQILDKRGENVTESIGSLKIETKAEPEYECRYRYEVVDRHDGSYIFRLKLWSSCEKIEIRIKSPMGDVLCDGNLVIGKKAILKLKSIRRFLDDPTKLLPESCDCPISSLDQWMTDAGCPNLLEDYSQLKVDLGQWSSINFSQVLHEVEQNWGNEKNRRSAALCHYKIVENEVSSVVYYDFGT